MAENKEAPKETEKPKAPEGKAPAEAAKSGKKALPTNCAQCNIRIRRKAWYYRNGKYFCGKNCAKLHAEKQLQEKEKAKAEQEKAKAESAAAASGAAKPVEP